MNLLQTLWGHDLLFADEENYSGRILFIGFGKETETVSHLNQDQTILVLNGVVALTLDGSGIILEEKDVANISKGSVFKFRAAQGDATILIVGEQYNPDKIVEVKV